jgi:hypothetical protein
MLTHLYMLEDDAMLNVVTVFQSLQMHDEMLYTPSVPNYMSFCMRKIVSANITGLT